MMMPSPRARALSAGHPFDAGVLLVSFRFRPQALRSDRTVGDTSFRS
jgi:hypothetical protein